MPITPENTKPWLLVMIQARHIHQCKYCGKDVTWLKNQRDKFYLVNVHDKPKDGFVYVIKKDFHHCEGR